MNIIFDISGGLGKNILATAVLKAIRKQHNKANIIIITSYPDVFINNPNVNRVVVHGTITNLYKDFIENKDSKVFIVDPYSTSDYITESKHLIEIWCNLCGVEYNGEQPEIIISKGEQAYFAPFYKIDKPIMVIQPNGGAADQPLKYSWTRDIPEVVMIDVINHYKEKYAIIHVKREDQIIYNDTIGALDSYRSIAVLLMLSEKRLLIDSSAMHLATALNLPSTVTWMGTSPKIFGYDIHTNIVANAPDMVTNLDNPYFQKYALFEDISRCPYSDLNKIFNVEDIIKSLE
jgi:ADP-heptose:LPS heptosyltransferase